MQLPPANAYYRKSWFLFLRQRKPAPPPCISSPRYPGRTPSGLSYSACSSRDRRPACLPASSRVVSPRCPRRAHVESASSPRPSHRQAAQCRLVLSTTTATTAAGRLGGWNACQGHRHGIGNLACGDANPPADTHQIGPGSAKIRHFMFSGPRASLLAGIELTSSDVRRVWLPLLRGFRTSASGRTTDGWLDVWCLYAPGDCTGTHVVAEAPRKRALWCGWMRSSVMALSGGVGILCTRGLFCPWSSSKS